MIWCFISKNSTTATKQSPLIGHVIIFHEIKKIPSFYGAVEAAFLLQLNGAIWGEPIFTRGHAVYTVVVGSDVGLWLYHDIS